MKKYKVIYSDREMSTRNERFETRPYPMPEARDLADALAIMGCHDFEFVPVKEAA